MSNKLKAQLPEIVGKVTDETSLEDIYLQLALLADIDKAEEQEIRGETIAHSEVIMRSAKLIS